MKLLPLSIGFFLYPYPLGYYRKVIDQIDDQIYNQLVERMKISTEIAKQKQQLSYPVEDKTREEQVFQRLLLKSNLSEKLVRNIWTEILEESKKVQFDV